MYNIFVSSGSEGQNEWAENVETKALKYSPRRPKTRAENIIMPKRYSPISIVLNSMGPSGSMVRL